jgi:hypothetical protein
VWAKEIDLYSTNQDCIKMLVGNKVDKVFLGRFTDSSVYLIFILQISFLFLSTLVCGWIPQITYGRKIAKVFVSNSRETLLTHLS